MALAGRRERGVRVLFVEDDAMNRRVVHDMLHVLDISMDEARDAPSGLQMIDDTHYDVVLMDLRMPGMDGLAAIRAIRALNDARAAVPIIVVTADASVDLRERCLAAGADDIIRKPVALSALQDALAPFGSARDDDVILD